ncbi:MAG: RdgB/HAM1 family non-canonical purine NTP pyrophosphatase [Candidatus Andersenbacteria bacterium]
MKIYFVTTNRHKFQEVQDILKDYPVKLEQLDRSYEENHDESIEIIARSAARKLAEELQQPVVVEDSGLYFEAYEGFPGALPKFVMNTLGFKGILKLLEGESRNAYFKGIVGFCMPGSEPQLFEGYMRGTITEEVHNPDADMMPYDKIFIPEGYTKTISDMTAEEKNQLSHRGEAFRKFGEYIKKLDNA